MKFLKLLLFFLPIPFVISFYLPTKNLISTAYLFKHTIVISLLIVSILIHYPFNKLTRFKPYFFASFTTFIAYLFCNLFLKSELKLLNIFYLVSFVILFLLAFVLSRLNNIRNILKFPYYGLITILLVTIVYSLINDINVYSEWATISYGETKRRWTFGFFHPGYFASFLMLSGILSHFLIRHRIISRWNYLVVIISVILIFLSGTRNSFISLCIYLLVSHSSSTYYYFKFLAGFIFFILLAVVGVNWNYINILSSGRLSTWIAHFIYNLDSFNFLFGTGLGNAERIGMASNTNYTSKNEMIFHIDNFYFEIFLQFGLIGLFLLIMVLMQLLKTIRKSCFTGYNRRVALALFYTLIFFAFFDSALISTGNLVSVILWIIFFTQLNFDFHRKTDHSLLTVSRKNN